MMTANDPTLEAIRHRFPLDAWELYCWVRHFTGLRIPRDPVCAGHTAPFDMFARQVLERPSLALWHGPRGSGKSFLSAIDTHLCSRFNPRHETRILGGSQAQSEQIYRALAEAVVDGRGDFGGDAAAITRLLKTEAIYRNGSRVAILAASPTSVRGPHVPSLKLDEVDEIDPDIRESALGMVMEIRGARASVLMTSTWHRLGGPMSTLIERGRAASSRSTPTASSRSWNAAPRRGAARTWRTARPARSCPGATRIATPTRRAVPRPSGASGHYTIDSLIQKVKAVSARVFASDYLCRGPRAEGVWFTQFDEADNVTRRAEFDPSLPYHIAVD